MRVKSLPGEEIPGEPGDDKVLAKMIDAPLGDRSAWRPQWPDTADLFIPFGEAKIVRAGDAVTVVTYGRMVAECAKAADELAPEGISAEVIDLRSLHPYDWAAIASSIKKTGRAVFVNEDTEITNFGEHLIRRAVEELWGELRTPPLLEAGKHVPGVGLADKEIF